MAANSIAASAAGGTVMTKNQTLLYLAIALSGVLGPILFPNYGEYQIGEVYARSCNVAGTTFGRSTPNIFAS